MLCFFDTIPPKYSSSNRIYNIMFAREAYLHASIAYSQQAAKTLHATSPNAINK